MPAGVPRRRRAAGSATLAATAGAAARRRATGRTTAATALPPLGSPAAGTGTPPVAGTTPSQPRRNYLWIILAVIAGLVAIALLGFFMRPTVNVNVNNGGSKVVINTGPGSPDTGSPTAAPSPRHSAKPATSTSPTPSPSHSTSSPMESEYSHWISPSDVTTACHEQASPETTAVFQNELYNASPVPDDWYCQIIKGYTGHYWYAANSSQPLGPIIPTSSDLSDVVNLSAYCQYTYGRNGDGQWKALDGPSNQNLNDPPAQGSNPFPHEMCAKVPYSGS